MGSWAAAVVGVCAVLALVIPPTLRYFSNKRKMQADDAESLSKATKSRKVQDVLSYFNRRNRH